jgi:lipopolysaccharide biosynthesis protein
LEDLGFISDAYVDLSRYEGRCNNSSIILANELLMQDRCPLVKRRAFFFPAYEDLLQISLADQVKELLFFLGTETHFDVSMIWEDILQTQKLSALRNNMHLSDVFPDQAELRYSGQGAYTATVVAYIKYIFQAEYLAKYQKSLPAGTNICVLYADVSIKETCEAILSDTQYTHRFFRIANEDHILLDALKRCEDMIDLSEYVCFLICPCEVEERLRIAHEDYCRYMYSSMLHSGGYVRNIIGKLRSDKFLGMIVPTQTDFGRNFSRKVAIAARHSRRINAVYNKLELDAPFDDEAVAFDNSVFWMPKQVYARVLDCLSQHSRFEKLQNTDYFNYIFPIMLQSLGYYTASATTTDNASVAIDNLHFMQRRFTQQIFRKSAQYTWSFENLMRTLDEMLFRQVSKKEMLKMTFGLREILYLLLRYPKTKAKHIFLRNKRPSNNFASLMQVEEKGGRVEFFMLSPKFTLKQCCLQINGRRYYACKQLTEAQQMISDYYWQHIKQHCAFFFVPLSALKNATVELVEGRNRRRPFSWTAGVSFNALELKKHGLRCRIEQGVFIAQTKRKFFFSTLFSKTYSLRDKLVFVFAAANPFHPLTIMAENLNGADNTFQLYQYALRKKEPVRYIASEQFINSERDPALRKKMLVHNSRRHIIAMLFAKRWITSFSLRLELMPRVNALKDIHYAMLPSDWTFVSHGIVADKIAPMVSKYSWDNPTRTFVSSDLEKKAYEDLYHFKSVYALGSPRMDKWADAIVDPQEILLFFTWRISLCRGASSLNRELFLKTDYFKTIAHLVRAVREAFPEKKISYVFHHDIVKRHYDDIIKDALAPFDLHYISFSDAEGASDFNKHFASAQYLITDYSSVAYDFAYKEGAIPVYYLNDAFIAGHYTLTKEFCRINLGLVTRNTTELIAALKLASPTEEMLRRRKAFFSHLDGNNAGRVFHAIFESPSAAAVKKVSSADNTDKRRLGIYLYYNPEGRAGAYVYYFLEHLKPHCDELCVVINGFVQADALAKLKRLCDKVIVRENIGFDSGAYKEAIESYGYQTIATAFDELLICNYTCYGPVYPFSEMFNAMAERTCDFWGHNRYIAGLKTGNEVIVDHIQSYFMVFRKNILQSECFEAYWATLVPPHNYWTAVTNHELKCTAYFEKEGFISDTFIPCDCTSEGRPNLPVFFAYSQLKNNRSPLLKRKVFFVKDGVFEFPQQEKHGAADILNRLEKNTDYPVGLILEDMKESYDIAACGTHVSKLKCWLKMAVFKNVSNTRYDAAVREKNSCIPIDLFEVKRHETFSGKDADDVS